MRRMSIISVVVLGLSLLLATGAAAEEREGLISWSSSSEIFPSSWIKAPFYAEADPAAQDQRERAQRLVRRALSKYPTSLVDKTLKKVHVVGELRFYRSQKFAGTASNTAIYLVIQDKREGYTDEFIEATFHREYSSLLLNVYRHHFDQKAWEAANPADFSYLGANSWDRTGGKGGGAKAIDSGKTSLTPETSDSALRYGFLTEYSTSSMENDFNEYAAMLFLNPPGFWKKVGDYEGVAEKSRLAIAFYQTIAPTLTRAYFQRLTYTY